MRAVLLVSLLVACKSSESPPSPTPPPTPPPSPAKKPPDEMDEKMRHCPVALDGGATTVADIDGGVRFTIQVPDAAVEEARRRARHIIEFAAKRTHEGHGEFDGKGGGRMKNCPVVTDGVTIQETDVPGGAQLDVLASDPSHLDQLRADTRERVTRFPFVGATITLAAPHP